MTALHQLANRQDMPQARDPRSQETRYPSCFLERDQRIGARIDEDLA